MYIISFLAISSRIHKNERCYCEKIELLSSLINVQRNSGELNFSNLYWTPIGIVQLQPDPRSVITPEFTK